MTHEYGDAINPEAFKAAVAMALKARADAPDVPLDVHIDEAVHCSFCSCVVDTEDEIEHGLSGTHAAIVGKVKESVEQLLG